MRQAAAKDFTYTRWDSEVEWLKGNGTAKYHIWLANGASQQACLVLHCYSLFTVLIKFPLGS